MNQKDQNQNDQNNNPSGELSDQQLDGVAGGQEIRKIEKVTVTAKRSDAEPIVKLEKVVVTAKREDTTAGAQVATASVMTKKN